MTAGVQTPRSPLLVLIGTQTGNAELVAEDMAEELGEAGLTVHLVDMADAYPELVAGYGRVILCTSTWGDVELPDNAIDLYEGLEALAPDLSHLAYGVFALGDHLYDPHFCAAARLFENLFDRLGAVRVIDTFEVDAGPTERDLKQARAWALRAAAFRTTSGAPAAEAKR